MIKDELDHKKLKEELDKARISFIKLNIRKN
jgi:hypothetical protein